MLRLAALGAVIAVVGTSGCGSDLRVNPEAYRGPSLEKESLDSVHVLIAEVPGAGWQVDIDETRRTADNTEVYVTLRRPNPAAAYPADPVSQRVVTRVPIDRPIGILARVMSYADHENRPYRRVR